MMYNFIYENGEKKIVGKSRKSNRMRPLVVIIKFRTEIIILQKS